MGIIPHRIWELWLVRKINHDQLAICIYNNIYSLVNPEQHIHIPVKFPALNNLSNLNVRKPKQKVGATCLTGTVHRCLNLDQENCPAFQSPSGMISKISVWSPNLSPSTSHWDPQSSAWEGRKYRRWSPRGTRERLTGQRDDQFSFKNKEILYSEKKKNSFMFRTLHRYQNIFLKKKRTKVN